MSNTNESPQESSVNETKSSDRQNFPKHHPAGLWVLFTTEMWERFCYYGMRAFLVLYIYSAATSTTNPGFGWSQSDAYNFYGYFTGLVYLMPLLCGWIADKFIGQHRSLLFGGILIALGEFTLAATEFVRHGEALPVMWSTDPVAMLTFFSGLGLIVVGTGFFKPCVSVMVGQLYGDGDPRRDGGFTIFYMGINIGAFFSPLVAGTIAEKIGWEWGFMTAGIGMIFGLITYSIFRPKYMAHIGLPPKKADEMGELTPLQKEKAERSEYERTRPLTRIDLDRVFVLLAMTLFTIAFWVAFEQAGSSLNVFAKKSTNRNVSESVPERIRTAIMLENEFVDDLEESIEAAEKIQASFRKNLGRLENNLNDKPEEEPAFQVPKKRLMPLEKLQNFMMAKEEAHEDDKKSAEMLVKELLQRAEKLPTQKIDPQSDTRGTTDAVADSMLGIVVADPSVDTQKLVVPPPGIATDEKLSEELSADLDKYRAAVAKIDEAKSRAEKQIASGQTLVRTFPATWYQSVNASCIVIFAPIFAFMWVFLGYRGLEPSTPVKFGIGLLLLSTSFMVMIPGAIEAQGGLAAPYWLVLSYMLATFGELCLSPVGLSMVTKLSPARYSSLLMGFWFVSSAIANWLSGFLAALFGSDEGAALNIWFGPQGGMADFFLLMTLIPATVGFIVLLLSPKLKKMMHGAG